MIVDPPTRREIVDRVPVRLIPTLLTPSMPASIFQSQAQVLAPTLSALPAVVCILACLFSKRRRLPAWYLIGPIASSLLGYKILRQLLSDFNLPIYILSLTPVLCGLLGIVLWYGRKIGEN